MRQHQEVGPYTPAQIEAIYQQIMDSGYYDASYNAEDWKPEPYRLMANILREIFFKDIPGKKSTFLKLPKILGGTKSPTNTVRHVVDLGCGVGFLVSHLRQVGVDAAGIEFSPGIYERIERATKEHVRMENSEAFFKEDRFTGISLLVALEVFEHLPINLLRKNLEKIAREHDGPVFLTIPSSGVDPCTGRVGFIETSPTRLQDMQRNALFSYLAMLDGKPGGGHITLASFRWWTDFFLANGFSRQFDMEDRLHSFDQIFQAYRWCPYVIRRLEADTLKFSTGWKSSAGGENLRLMTGGYSQIEVRTTSDSEAIFEFEALDPNRNLDGKVLWSVYQLVMDDQTAAFDYVTLADGRFECADSAKMTSLKIPIKPKQSSDASPRVCRIEFHYSQTKLPNGPFEGLMGGLICREARLKRVGD
jgi:SAM-dependent methyltransferase